MITRAMGIPTFQFYTNFQPVFDSMREMSNSYSKLLQTSSAFINPSIKHSVHIDPHALDNWVKNSSVGKHVNVVG